MGQYWREYQAGFKISHICDVLIKQGKRYGHAHGSPARTIILAFAAMLIATVLGIGTRVSWRP